MTAAALPASLVDDRVLATPVEGPGIADPSTLGDVLGDELSLLVFLRHLG